MTAYGVLHGMRAGCAVAFGSDDLRGRRVVIQGAGHVGRCLAHLLVDAGAHVSVADVDAGKAAAVGVPVIAPGDVIAADCDVLAPCALGGVLTHTSVQQLRCALVCGAANNQLLDIAVADELDARGIVYAPDYVVNAGGIINIAHEWHPEGYAVDRARAQAAAIEETTHQVLARARTEGISTARAADDIAWRRIAAEGLPPYRPGEPSVMRDALLARRERFR